MPRKWLAALLPFAEGDICVLQLKSLLLVCARHQRATEESKPASWMIWANTVLTAGACATQVMGPTPEGHRAPIAELFHSTCSVDTQTPSGSEGLPNSASFCGTSRPDSPGRLCTRIHQQCGQVRVHICRSDAGQVQAHTRSVWCSVGCYIFKVSFFRVNPKNTSRSILCRFWFIRKTMNFGVTLTE